MWLSPGWAVALFAHAGPEPADMARELALTIASLMNSGAIAFVSGVLCLEQSAHLFRSPGIDRFTQFRDEQLAALFCQFSLGFRRLAHSASLA